jgi:hypothetical protein
MQRSVATVRATSWFKTCLFPDLPPNVWLQKIVKVVTPNLTNFDFLLWYKTVTVWYITPCFLVDYHQRFGGKNTASLQILAFIYLTLIYTPCIYGTQRTASITFYPWSANSYISHWRDIHLNRPKIQGVFPTPYIESYTCLMLAMFNAIHV